MLVPFHLLSRDESFHIENCGQKTIEWTMGRLMLDNYKLRGQKLHSW